VKASFDAAVDRCSSCGEAAQISPRLEGQPRLWALRSQGWLALTPKAGDPWGERRLMCAHCLVAPPPRAVELLSSWGIPIDAFVNLKPPVPTPRRAKARRASETTLVRKCSSCGRWLDKAQAWTVRLGAELRPGTAKLSAKERGHALWYCGSAGCQAQAKRFASQRGREG
jgi:hypothetical protein